MKLFSNHYIILLFFVVFIYSCDSNKSSSPENNRDEVTEFNLKDAKRIIQDKTQRFTEAHITKDTAYLNSSFTNDARIFPPNSVIVSGRKDISQLNYDWVNFGIYEFKEVSTAFYGSEEYLIDEGNYYLRYGEENTVDEGKYINIWKMDNGEWKIYSNIWNTNLPVTWAE